MNVRTVLLSLVLLVAASGCGNDENDTRFDDQTNLRFFNAVPDLAGVDFLVDSRVFFPASGYLESSGYFEMDTESRTYEAVQTGSFVQLAVRTAALADDRDHTFAVIGRSNEARLLFLTDDNQPASGDVAKVRLTNVSTSAPSVDVFVRNSGRQGDLDTPSWRSLGFGGSSNYLISTEGSYDVIVTEARSETVLGRRDRVPFLAGEVYSVFIADRAPGTLPLTIVVLDDTGR